MTETNLTLMMRGAVDGTTSLLRSALAAASTNSKSSREPLRSVVYMSSISAVFAPNKGPEHTYTADDWNDEAEREVERLGVDTPGYVIYQASKTAGERAFWKFHSENAPPFKMVALCPA